MAVPLKIARERDLERDLYARLLDLPDNEDLADIVEDGLAVAVGRTKALRGYVELLDIDDDEPFLWAASGCTHEGLDSLRAELSRGIAHSAMTSGEVILSAAALRDPRFSARNSVRENRIRAVLCAPILGSRLSGVLYLQGRSEPGPFGNEDVALVKRLARSFAALGDRMGPSAVGHVDQTAGPREILDADDLVGHSKAFSETLRLAAMVAPFPTVHVMMHGPSGAGKSELAKAIHRSGPRSSGPLVVVACGALPHSLIEAELFGCVDGAFTGARPRPGLLRSAHGGTVILDEIDALPLNGQASLLRFLQHGKLRAIGADVEHSVDARVIATSNADLEALVNEGRFRADLYNRLSMFQVRVPGLHERRSDIPHIARALVGRLASKHLGERPMILSVQAANMLAKHSWDGHIRELEHALLLGVLSAVADGESEVLPKHVLPDQEPTNAQVPCYREAWLDWLEGLLQHRLDECDHNVSATARSLKISRSRAYELLDLVELKR